MEVPEGAVVAYSTRPGSVASDGDGDYSPFARAFADSVAARGLTIDDVLRVVTELVHDETRGAQIPVAISTFKDNLVLSGNERAKVVQVSGRKFDLTYLEQKPNPMGVCLVNIPEGDTLNVRTGPAITFPLLQMLPNNACGIASLQSCVPTGTGNHYCLLEFLSGRQGWVASKVYLKYDSKRKVITRE